MKKITLILSIVFATTLSYAQAPAIQWQKSFGGTSEDFAICIHQTTDGGFILAGYSISNNGDVSGNHGGTDCWIVKLSSAGSIIWQKSLGGSGEDYAVSVQQTTDGGYIIAGYSTSNDGDVSGSHGSYFDYWIAKLSPTGSIIWQQSLGGTQSDNAYSIQQTTDGGYIVAGYTFSNNGDVSGNHGGQDAWIVKLNSSGGILWQKSLGGTGNDLAYSIQQTTDGGFVMAGYNTSNSGDVSGNHGGQDAWIVKLNSSGGVLWQKSFGGTNEDIATSVRQTTDGGFILAGYSNSNDGDVSGNHGHEDYWIVKLSATGSIIWQKSLGGTYTDYPVFDAVKQTTDGGYIIAGLSNSNDGDVSGNHGGQDYWIFKLSSTGNLLWQKSLGGTKSEEAHSIQQTTDGGFIVAGYTLSNNGDVSGNHSVDYNDAWIVKLGPSTDINTIGSKQVVTLYPNPVHDMISMSGIDNANIKIYNAIGQLMKEADDTNNISLIGLSAGTYFIELSDDNGVLYCQKILKQ